MPVQHTVMEFTKIQFLGNWNRQPTTNCAIYYTADKPKKINLKVIWQGAAGTPTTYEFIVPYKDPAEQGDFNQVWVNWAENIIHVPVLCLKSAVGDTARCTG